MKTLSLAALGLVATLLVAVSPANAQLRIGGGLGFEFDDTNLLLNANAIIPGGVALGESTIRYNPEFNYFFIDHATFFVVSFNFLYPFSMEAADIYAGAGLLLSFFSFDVNTFASKSAAIQDETDVTFGLNTKGGVEFGKDKKLKPFGELGYYVKDGGFLYVQGGLRFALGDE